MDGIEINCIEHPRPVWYKRPYYFIRYFFTKPKLSKESLEPVDIDFYKIQDKMFKDLSSDFFK